MGNVYGSEKDVNTFVRGLTEGPDLRVNQNIVKFCSLDSSENLRRYYKQRKLEAADCAADWIKNLVEKLAGLTSAPELAGLGALVIAILIDVVSFSPPEESTKEALRCVFAEEKASEVWDQIDECLKRCMMHINNNDELRSNIRRIEIKLSEALTKLKNSMVRDGQMSSQALKAWVNGAAFHIQMLIHLVRLSKTQTCDPVEKLLSAYQSDLDTLLGKHREMVENKCSKEIKFIHHQAPYAKYLVDEDSKWHRMLENGNYNEYFEAYYNHRYSRQKSEVQQYFRGVGENLQSLVHQTGSFTVQ